MQKQTVMIPKEHREMEALLMYSALHMPEEDKERFFNYIKLLVTDREAADREYERAKSEAMAELKGRVPCA